MRNSEIKAALRIFYREKSYAVINLCGLSLAIACCLILGLYLKSELTYDLHNARHKEIYRAVCEFTEHGGSKSFAVTSVRLGPMLKENFPEVKDYVRIAHSATAELIQAGNKSLYWDDVCWADENIFDIFTHSILYGDPKTALKDPSSAAVSETFAKRHFGDANPIGRTIQVEVQEHIPRRISLVFRDLPENSHLKYNVLFRLDGSANYTYVLWDVHYFTYLVMPENYDVRRYKAISASFYSRFMEMHSTELQQTWRSWLQPLADIHLHSDVGYDLPGGNRYYVFGFAAVAAFILLVACINYVNLAVARAARRSKEIAMRKILGVSRFRLACRFLGEAVVFSVIAVIIGCALVELALKLTSISDLLGKKLTSGFVAEPMLLPWVFGFSLVIGLLAGFYPAIYLSSISPFSALSGSSQTGSGHMRLRELLVLVQFTVSAVVIACTLIMALQMRYISKRPLGFEKESRVLITLHGADLVEKYEVLKNDLLKNSNILGVSSASSMIGLGTQNMPILSRRVDNKEGVPEQFAFHFIQIEDNFPEVMGMQLASGRDFSKRLLTDVGSTFIVNEAMVKARGWADPLGRRILGLTPSGHNVIGVVKDFPIRSLRSPVEPFVMYRFTDDLKNLDPRNRPGYQRIMVVHIAGNDVQKTLQFLQDKLAGYDPKHPFEYAFLDDSIDKLYTSEDHLIKMIGIFSGVCIFISCLGLFGLAAFTTEQRSKEIGIRKVVGASASQIILMLSRRILWLVLAGSVVASAAAYYLISLWLTAFAYKVSIPPLVFILSAALLIMVAFVTIALQSYRTAQANPAVMMRYE